MTYNPAIPGANDLISQSQAQIQTNFSQANTAIAVDHVAFDVLTNQGMHKKVTFQNVLGANPNQISPIASLYTKVSSTTSTSDLYYQDGALASNVKQLTGGGITAAAWCTFSVAAGVVTVPANGTSNVTSVVRNSQGIYTISFTRNFVAPGTNYIAIVSPDMQSVNGFAIKIASAIKSAGSYQFTLQDQTNTFRDPVSCDLVFFGVLT